MWLSEYDKLRLSRAVNETWDTLKQTEEHPPQLRYFVLLLLSLVIFLTGCGIIPPKLSLYEPPPVSDPASAAHVIVARKFQYYGLGGIEFYIILDGHPIAALWPRQYTEFLLSSGQHTIGVRFSMLKRHSTFGEPVDWKWYPYHRREWLDFELTEEFAAGKEYKFLVSNDSWLVKPKLEKVQSFPNNISLDPSKMVLPGTK